MLKNQPQKQEPYLYGNTISKHEFVFVLARMLLLACTYLDEGTE